MGTKMPRPLPGTDEAGFEKMVNKFKAMLRTMKLSPFNREIWSKGTFFGSSSPTPAPAPSPAAAPNIIPGETRHHHKRIEPPSPGPSPSDAKKPSDTPIDEKSAYDRMTEYVKDICKNFGIDC
jgi:hypothetical protein